MALPHWWVSWKLCFLSLKHTLSSLLLKGFSVQQKPHLTRNFKKTTQNSYPFSIVLLSLKILIFRKATLPAHSSTPVKIKQLQNLELPPFSLLDCFPTIWNYFKQTNQHTNDHKIKTNHSVRGHCQKWSMVIHKGLW